MKEETINELSKYVGKVYLAQLEGVWVEVQAVEARWSFGRVDLEVEPTKGEGKIWKQLRFLRKV